jgi:hypothetical protein
MLQDIIQKAAQLRLKRERSPRKKATAKKRRATTKA